MSGPLDRDAALEHLLRAAPPEGPEPTEDCLDAEAIAALADGGLTPGVRQAYLTHVASCAHCQALLAAVVRTAPVPAPRLAWWRVRPWLVPALAGGLAVAMWVAVDRTGPRVQVVALPEPPAVRQELQSPAATREPEPKLDPLARQTAAAEAQPRRMARTVGNAAVPTTPQPAASIAGAVAPVQAPRADAAAESTFAVGTPPPPFGGGAPLEARAGVAADAPASPPVPTLPSARTVLAAPASPPPPGRPSVALTQEASAARAERVVIVDAAKATASPAAIEIASSDPRIRWRIAGTSVERSADGGATWTAQAIGVSSRLTAGSAPLPEVCWIVGEGGTVVVTADGLSWTRVSFPVQVPLAAVTATSADAATVTTSDGRVFATQDRGRTWR